jgi:hypothetical protein
MSKKNRLSRDQERQKKLAKRERRQPQSDESLAYTGNRYKKDEFVEPLFQTERAIYSQFVISGRQITDDDVQEGLVELIEDLRARPVAELIFDDQSDDEEVVEASIPRLILNDWRDLLEARRLPGRSDLIGILRTILGSLETWRAQSASARGYLNYLEGFMNEMGVSIQVASEDGGPLSEGTVDELYEVGEMWLAGSPEAQHHFNALANELLKQGKPDRVVNACQRLMASVSSPARPEFAILTELTIRAQKTPAMESRKGLGPGLKNFISRLARW